VSSDTDSRRPPRVPASQRGPAPSSRAIEAPNGGRRPDHRDVPASSFYHRTPAPPPRRGRHPAAPKHGAGIRPANGLLPHVRGHPGRLRRGRHPAAIGAAPASSRLVASCRLSAAVVAAGWSCRPAAPSRQSRPSPPDRTAGTTFTTGPRRGQPPKRALSPLAPGATSPMAPRSPSLAPP
jgi:hypothetical protein